MRAGDLGAGGGHHEAAHKGAGESPPESWAVLPSATAWRSSPGLLLLERSSPHFNDLLSQSSASVEQRRRVRRGLFFQKTLWF